jgi:hypothetical protein
VNNSSSNTALGYQALTSNTLGAVNTALGYQALMSNTNGQDNTANGAGALADNTSGTGNTASGSGALVYNTTGYENTAEGYAAMEDNTVGFFNTANGFCALEANSTGSENTADGALALSGATNGRYNIGVGFDAGQNVTDGSNNIEIFDPGKSGDNNTIRIGTEGTQREAFIAGIDSATVTGAAVYVVSGTGQLGVQSSSERFKRDIQDMGSASEAILALRPVTYRYKPEIDPKGTPQFGLVAEEVERVSPSLVVHDANNRVFTVRYEAVNAMLLNEFRKQHDHVKEQDRVIADQARRADEQQQEIDTLKLRLIRFEAMAARIDGLGKPETTR